MNLKRIQDLAVMASADPDAIPVLADAIEEERWTDARVMMLCIGVPLDPLPPWRLGQQAALTWTEKRTRSIETAQTMAEQYATARRADWARAVLACLIFGEWPTAAKLSPYGTRSPWPIVRELQKTSDDDAAAYGRRNAERRRESRANAKAAQEYAAANTTRAATSPVAIQCKHGYDVCPICDRPDDVDRQGIPHIKTIAEQYK